MKRVISYFMTISILLSLFFVNVAADDNITIYVNEQILQCDAAPFIDNGRTMVPMRKIFEALGAVVDWEEETQTITASKGDNVIMLQIDNSTMFNNGEAEILDTAPVVVNDSTFVPVRAVSQSLNASVEWIEHIQSVYINSPEKYSNEYIESGQEEEKVIMYAPDGRTLEIIQSEIEAYKNVGWYTEPVTLMYAPDGRTIYVMNSEIEAYKNVGWYTEPVTLMYAPDGRTIYVMNSEVEAYKNVGWYKTYREAQEAIKPSSASGSSYETGNQNRPNSGGSSVYRTPSGKRYHFDPDCGGKNSYKITLQKAKNSGLTPCKKCAQ